MKTTLLNQIILTEHLVTTEELEELENANIKKSNVIYKY